MIKKTLLLFALTALCSAYGFSQAKALKNLDDQYSRNSVTKLFVSYDDRYNDAVENAYSSFGFGEKYNYNDLGISRINVRNSRDDISDLNVLQLINQNNIGKSILSFWFNRNSDGTMSYDKVQERGLYNVNDGDVMISEAAKVSQLNDMGDKLIKDSYVVVFNTKNIKRKESKDKKTGKVTVSWQAKTFAYVYQLVIDSTFFDEFYGNMWIQDNDSPADKAAKKKLFDDLQMNMRPVAAVSHMASSTVTEKNPEDKAIRSAISSSFDNLLFEMEKKIPEWQVKVPIYETHPIRCKIGTKENLKNGTRYRVYKYLEDEQGNLKTRPIGYVRATTIADNKMVASGQSPTSRFYQIAGGHLEPGMLMRENKDKGIGISVGGQYHGVNTVFVDADYLMHISNWGGCSNILLGLGFDYREAIYMDLNFGFGYGIPVTRWVELMPYAKIGFDGMAHEKDENKKNSYSTGFVEGGLRFSLQPVYPFRIFVQADYSKKFFTGNCYVEGDNRFGVGLCAGIRYAF